MVIVTAAEGEEVAYVWVLSRQIEGTFEDCCMTDAVIPADRGVERRLTQRSILTETRCAA